jgi:hypothetical protein
MCEVVTLQLSYCLSSFFFGVDAEGGYY